MDTIINQALSTSENNLFISQIFKIIFSLKWDNKHKLRFITSCLFVLPKVFLILLLKHTLKDIDPIIQKCMYLVFFIEVKCLTHTNQTHFHLL